MTTKANEEKTVKLLDGEEITIRPLRISLLREFMKKFEKLADVADDNDKSITLLLECVQIAMKQYSPKLSEDIKALEDVLDLPTVYAIVQEASGVDISASAAIANKL
jgi:hypothetical protein